MQMSHNVKTTRQQMIVLLSEKDMSARELSQAMNLEANTSGTRLLNLHKKKLVKRKDEIREGGRVWVYENIL